MIRPYHPPTVIGRRAAIELPHVTPEQALLLFEILEELASAIWAAHDPEIGDLAAQQAMLEATLRDVEDADPSTSASASPPKGALDQPA
jgi:hypothetical protein